jgi:hypothetical protein
VVVLALLKAKMPIAATMQPAATTWREGAVGRSGR